MLKSLERTVAVILTINIFIEFNPDSLKFMHIWSNLLEID